MWPWGFQAGRTVIITVQLNQVEGVHGCVAATVLTPDAVERGDALVIARNGVAIDGAGVRPQSNYQREIFVGVAVPLSPFLRAMMPNPSCLIS